MSKGFDIWLRFRYMTPGALPKYRNKILHITCYHKLHLQKKKSFDIMSKVLTSCQKVLTSGSDFDI